MVEGCCGWGRSGSMTSWFFLPLMLFVLWPGHTFQASLFFDLNMPLMVAMAIVLDGGSRHKVRSFVLLILVFMATLWGSHYLCAHFIDEETDAWQNLTLGHPDGDQMAITEMIKITWSFFTATTKNPSAAFENQRNVLLMGLLEQGQVSQRYMNPLTSHSPVDLLFLPALSNAMQLFPYSSTPDILWSPLVISFSFSRFQHPSNSIFLLLN